MSGAPAGLQAAREAALACEEEADEAWLEGGQQKPVPFQQALSKYHEGIEWLEKVEPPVEGEDAELLARLHASCAQTLMDLGRPYAARQAASDALELIPPGKEETSAVSATARMHRGRAIVKMEQAQEMYYEDEEEHDELLEIAYEDFQMVLRVEPGNAQAKGEFNELERLVKEWRRPGGRKDPDGSEGAWRSGGLRRSSSAGRLERPRSASFSEPGSTMRTPWGAGPGLAGAGQNGGVLLRNPSTGSLVGGGPGGPGGGGLQRNPSTGSLRAMPHWRTELPPASSLLPGTGGLGCGRGGGPLPGGGQRVGPGPVRALRGSAVPSLSSVEPGAAAAAGAGGPPTFPKPDNTLLRPSAETGLGGPGSLGRLPRSMSAGEIGGVVRGALGAEGSNIRGSSPTAGFRGGGSLSGGPLLGPRGVSPTRAGGAGGYAQATASSRAQAPGPPSSLPAGRWRPGDRAVSSAKAGVPKPVPDLGANNTLNQEALAAKTSTSPALANAQRVGPGGGS